MTNEILSKKVGNVISSIINTPYWKKNELQISLKEVLLTKRKRTTSQEEYLETLLRNIAYFIDYTNELKLYFYNFIRVNKLPHNNDFVKHMGNVRSQVNAPENLAKTMNLYKAIVYKGDSILEQVANAETIYCTCKLVNDMMIDFISILLQPENRKFVEEFFKFVPEEVVETTFNYCKVYTNLYLDDISA